MGISAQQLERLHALGASGRRLMPVLDRAVATCREDRRQVRWAIGEHINDADDLGWMSGTWATLRNTSRLERPKDFPMGAKNAQAPEDPLFVGGFGSWHAGDLVVCGMADGAVRIIRRGVSPEFLRQLGDRADGELPADERD